MPRLRLDRADLRRTMRGASRRELTTTGRRVVNRAKILAPVDTGRLRASIRMDPPRLFSLRPSVTIGSDVFYAPYVNDGARPHVIRPKRGKALRFVIGGQVVFARVVQHPGTRPNPFLNRALAEITRPLGYDVTLD